MNFNFPIEVQKLINLFNDMNIDAYIVGGALRDMLINKNPVDYDFTAELNEKEHYEASKKIAEILKCKLDYNDYYHTAKFLLDGFTVDFVMAREEYYGSYAAKPVIHPSSLYNDLKRRDFTINTISASVKDFELYDPFHGIQDLEKKMLRILHEKSFEDDPTRILRSIKYASRLGLSYDDGTEKLVKEAAEKKLLNYVNINILKEELDNVFIESSYKLWVELLKKYDILNIMCEEKIILNDDFDYCIFNKLKFTDKLIVLLFKNTIEVNKIIAGKMQLNKKYIRNIEIIKSINSSSYEEFCDSVAKAKKKVKIELIKSIFNCDRRFNQLFINI